MAKITTRKPHEYITPPEPELQEYIDPKMFPGFCADDAGKVLTVNENGEWCCQAGGGGGGGCVVFYASENRIYADEDMTDEIKYIEEIWLEQIHSGKLVLLYDMDDDWHGYLITNVDGRTINCGHKAFYTNGGYPQES